MKREVCIGKKENGQGSRGSLLPQIPINITDMWLERVSKRLGRAHNTYLSQRVNMESYKYRPFAESLYPNCIIT
jgi:hypothetical protein